MLLPTLARDNAALPARVNEALPPDASGFDVAINALVKGLSEVAGTPPADVNVDDFIQSAPAILSTFEVNAGPVVERQDDHSDGQRRDQSTEARGLAGGDCQSGLARA